MHSRLFVYSSQIIQFEYFLGSQVIKLYIYNLHEINKHTEHTKATLLKNNMFNLKPKNSGPIRNSAIMLQQDLYHVNKYQLHKR